MTATDTTEIVAARRPVIRRRSAIPGFALTMGVTLTILSLIVLIPLSAVALKASEQTFPEFLQAAFNERALTAYRLSFGAAFIAAIINGVFGVLTAWALIRYQFPFKSLVNGIIDLPFTVLFDSQGQVRQRKIGELSSEDLANWSK